MKYIFALCATLTTLLSLLPVAQADGFHDDRWYISVFGSYLGADSHRGGDGGGGGMGIGKILNDHFNIELRGFGGLLGASYIDTAAVGHKSCNQGSSFTSLGTTSCTTDDGNRKDLTIGGGMVDLQYYFTRDTFSPYAVISAGIMNTDKYVGNVSALGFVGEAGAGLNYALTDNFFLRSDIRYRYNNNFGRQLLSGTDEYHDFTVNFGLVYVFGDKH
ncbi:MAG: outer membrane beta-barrel protein [Methyloglobulus sp.]|nr:outer membrane beta-barrel protein [Methyloglobulus sp.]